LIREKWIKILQEYVPMKKIYLALFLVLFLATAAFAKLDLNKATVDELTALSGIGPTKAESIVKYRDEIKGFKTIDDLKDVKGIGDKTFEKIKKEITVEETKKKTEVKKK